MASGRGGVRGRRCPRPAGDQFGRDAQRSTPARRRRRSSVAASVVSLPKRRSSASMLAPTRFGRVTLRQHGGTAAQEDGAATAARGGCSDGVQALPSSAVEHDLAVAELGHVQRGAGASALQHSWRRRTEHHVDLRAQAPCRAGRRSCTSNSASAFDAVHVGDDADRGSGRRPGRRAGWRRGCSRSTTALTPRFISRRCAASQRALFLRFSTRRVPRNRPSLQARPTWRPFRCSSQATRRLMIWLPAHRAGHADRWGCGRTRPRQRGGR